MTIEKKYKNSKAIQLENISKTFYTEKNKIKIFENVNLSFYQSSSYAITGASGNGKSSLLHLIGFLDKPTSGKIKVLGLEKKPLEKIFSFVFQDHCLIEELTAEENIAVASILSKNSLKEAKEKAERLLNENNLDSVKNLFPSQMSGGQKQRVAILRAIVSNPEFILADEPTGNLDQENAQKVLDLLLKVKKENKCGLIICTHDKNIYEKMENIVKIENKNFTLQKH